MIKYFIPLVMLLTSCEASLHLRMVPNCDPLLPIEEVGVTESLQIEEPLG